MAVETCAIPPLRIPECANFFFAIINLEMSVQEKKRDWFDLGAKAYSHSINSVLGAR